MPQQHSGSYTEFRFPMKNTVVSLIAIVASAVPGVLLAWLAITAIGLNGTPLALATVFLGMVFATALFAAIVASARAVGLIKK